ncbi:MAG TPA: aminotransferase class V-fold PLP-dependent enzyme [Acidobacteriota bacterium]|nr:aminotransferase class V-fold PLP-dependent enzyme [Acidobacteriota bacterium]
MSEHTIYLDNNATTPVDPAVVEKMAAFLRERFGNPSSPYPVGRLAKEALTESREAVAGFLGAHRSEITFTGSGTEADNFALQGVLEAYPDKTEIVTSAIEHPAVLETARALEKRGVTVRYAPVDGTGLVDLEFIRSAVTPRTALVSIMHANNELGTIQPIEEIARIAHDKGALVHTDAVQSFGKIPVDVDRLGVDLLTVSAHKIYGPKGVGALYIRRGTDIRPFIHGGHQEHGLRAGTENTAGIVGFGEAVRVLGERMKKDKDRIEKLAERLKTGIESRVPKVRFNGHPERRVKSTLNFAFPGLEAEAILLALATKGISVSTGSACSEDSEEASHVLLAIGLRPEIARSCIRMSLGRFNTEEDVATVLAELPEIVDKLRKISAFDPAE